MNPSQQQLRRLQILSKHIPRNNNNDSNDVIFLESTSAELQSDLNRFPFLIQPEVKRALEQKLPVVALESTIISHGMPYPENVATAKRVEQVIREQGAIPATIAILDGRICVGLNNDQLDLLGRLGSKVRKCSRRDMALVVAEKGNGATTVAGTMMVAHMVGIHVFVTGGIGGVHRGGETTMDISADLTELGRTPVAVVCAGAKSILDIPRTLEFLETQGVAVVGYGTEEFPAFFTPHSGSPASCRLDTPEQCARLIHTNTSILNLQTGIVIGVPIPQEHAAAALKVENAIKTALNEADAKKIMGRDVTPFLLKRINELTKGESLKSNIALVLNNAKIGAQIAKELSNIQRGQNMARTTATTTPRAMHSDTNINAHNRRAAPVPAPAPVVLIGGAVVDLLGKPKTIVDPHSKEVISQIKFQLFTSTPGEIHYKLGGVARNVSEVLNRLEAQPFLISAVGSDKYGEMIKQSLAEYNMDASGVTVVDGERTAVYCAIFDEKGDLIAAIADMDLLANAINEDMINKYEQTIAGASIVFVDGNISVGAMRRIGHLCKKYNVPIFFEPTSVEKSLLPIKAGVLDLITYVKPNEDEIVRMALELRKLGAVTTSTTSSSSSSSSNNNNNNKKTATAAPSVEECIQTLLAAGVKHVLLTIGAKGVIWGTITTTTTTSTASLSEATTITTTTTTKPTNNNSEAAAVVERLKQSLRSSLASGGWRTKTRTSTCGGTTTTSTMQFNLTHFDALPLKMVNCTGAGDNFAAGFIFGLQHGLSMHESILCGMRCARTAIECDSAVNPSLSIASLA